MRRNQATLGRMDKSALTRCADAGRDRWRGPVRVHATIDRRVSRSIFVAVGPFAVWEIVDTLVEEEVYPPNILRPLDRRRVENRIAPAVLKVSDCPKRECPIFCVTGIWSVLPERSKDDDDFQGTAGRTFEGLRAG